MRHFEVHAFRKLVCEALCAYYGVTNGKYTQSNIFVFYISRDA